MKLNKGISLQLNYFDLANLEISLNIFFAILARRSTSFFQWVSMVQRSKFALKGKCSVQLITFLIPTLSLSRLRHQYLGD